MPDWGPIGSVCKNDWKTHEHQPPIGQRTHAFPDPGAVLYPASHGKTVVIKYGGNAMADASPCKQSFARDVVFLETGRYEPGGGTRWRPADRRAYWKRWARKGNSSRACASPTARPWTRSRGCSAGLINKEIVSLIGEARRQGWGGHRQGRRPHPARVKCDEKKKKPWPRAFFGRNRGYRPGCRVESIGPRGGGAA